MRSKFVEFVMKAMGVQPLKPELIPLQEVLQGRNLEEDITQVDLATLKALFRWSGKELRKRL